MKKLHNIRGISLMEVMLSLAIIAIILTLATRFFSTANEAENINNASTMIQTARSASQRWMLTNNGSLKDISVQKLIDHDLLPANFAKNPWAGDVTIAMAPNNSSKVRITFKAIPKTACENLMQTFRDPSNPTLLGTCHDNGNNMTDYVGDFTP